MDDKLRNKLFLLVGGCSAALVGSSVTYLFYRALANFTRGELTLATIISALLIPVAFVLGCVVGIAYSRLAVKHVLTGIDIGTSTALSAGAGRRDQGSTLGYPGGKPTYPLILHEPEKDRAEIVVAEDD